MFVTRWKLSLILMIAIATSAATHATETDPYADPKWPNIASDGPQWPNANLDDPPSPPPNPRPAFLGPDQVTARIMGRSRGAGSGLLDVDTTGSTAQWPKLPKEEQPSSFMFEAGARYWYSSGTFRFAFSNGNPLFGTPTSTLDWLSMDDHSGEGFARLDHTPTGYFVKGVVGAGALTSGKIDDKDFFAGQLKFSDTTSDVRDGNLAFAMIDFGWAFSPTGGVKLGVFAGYHYWREKANAYGLYCNQTQPALGCPSVGSVPIGYDVAVLTYEPTWHAVRLGAEARVAIDDRWSVSGELAAIPYAVLQNKDSHLLRQSSSDLGPAPNVITDGRCAYGIETELFVNYALTRNIEIGAGVRYWGLFSSDGRVHFGPSFASNYSLENFDQQRYGVLAHIKGKF